CGSRWKLSACCSTLPKRCANCAPKCEIGPCSDATFRWPREFSRESNSKREHFSYRVKTGSSTRSERRALGDGEGAATSEASNSAIAANSSAETRLGPSKVNFAVCHSRANEPKVSLTAVG